MPLGFMLLVYLGLRGHMGLGVQAVSDQSQGFLGPGLT